MNFFFHPVWTEHAELITTALLHFLWQGAILPLILLSTVKLLGVITVRARYLLSVGALVAMGLAPFVTVAWHQRAIAAPVSELSVPSNNLRQDADLISGIDTPWRQVSDTLHRPHVEAAIVIAWFAGVFVFSARLAMGLGLTLWIRANVKPLSEPFEQRAHRIGKQLKVSTQDRVFVSRKIGQAVALGLIRPIVLIPASWLTTLDPPALEAVIAHELAHIRRWDLWVNLLQRVIETLLFYHPAVWWLSRRIRLEREMCCDELAASCLDRAEYARSLESVARLSRGNLLMATSFQGERQMELLNRIRHLLGASPMAKESNGWAAGFVALSVPCLVAAAMTLAAGSMPAAAVAEDEKPVETKEIQVKVGDRVGMKISGDLFDKFFGLVFPGRKIEPGTQEFFIGTITGDLPDGRCQIEYTNGVDRGDQTPQLFSMTAVVPRSQIKMPPPLPKNQKIVAMIDGKTTTLNLVVIGSDDPTKNVPSDKTAVPTLLVEEIKRDYYYLELSELKGVKFKLWELQREIGE